MAISRPPNRRVYSPESRAGSSTQLLPFPPPCASSSLPLRSIVILSEARNLALKSVKTAKYSDDVLLRRRVRPASAPASFSRVWCGSDRVPWPLRPCASGWLLMQRESFSTPDPRRLASGRAAHLRPASSLPLPRQADAAPPA